MRQRTQILVAAGFQFKRENSGISVVYVIMVVLHLRNLNALVIVPAKIAFRMFPDKGKRSCVLRYKLLLHSWVSRRYFDTSSDAYDAPLN